MSPDELIVRVLVLLAVSLAATAFAWRARLLKRRVAVAPHTPRSAAPTRAEPTLAGAFAAPVDERLAETMRQQALSLALRAAPAAGANADTNEGAAPGPATDATLPARPALLGHVLASARDAVALAELLDALRREPALLAGLHDHPGEAISAHTGELRIALETGRVTDAGAAARLRAAIGAALLQPLYAAPFAGFAGCTWTLARNTGLAAAAAARRAHDCDPAAACVLGLVHGLGPLLALRDALAGEPALAHAAPELLAERIAQRADGVAHRLAVDWDLPAALRSALAEHSERIAPARMSALGRALHLGRLFGLAALLREHAALPEAGFSALLAREGLGGADREAIERALREPEVSR